MKKKYTGHCACGQVTYGFDSEPSFVANCHCTDCKRASGGEMAPKAEIFTWSRQTWMRPLDLPQFDHGPTPTTAAA
jgi:hypothetical protein